MEDVFCRIVSGDVSAEKVYENNKVLAIKDVSPKAKVHIVIFPKKHLASTINDPAADSVLQEIFIAARNIAKQMGVDESGYRILTNHAKDAGQSVDHIHFHFLAGEKLKDI